jgi:hypothetical protein
MRDFVGVSTLSSVMPGLVPGIHVFSKLRKSKYVHGRDKPGHDDSASGVAAAA